MTEHVKNEASNEVRELSDDEMTLVAGGFHYVLSGGFGSRPPGSVPYHPNAPFNPPFPPGFGGPIAGGPINEPGGSGWD
jgi:hypothetical protein